MKRPNPRLSLLFFRYFWITSFATIFTNIAVGQEESMMEKAAASLGAKVDEVVSGMAASELEGKFLSDGSTIEISRLGIKIAPPQGWEVITSNPSLSLVMQEPAPEKIEYDKAIFQRNITVVAVHEPTPIDEDRAKNLQDELAKTLAKQGVVSNFQFLEHKFFDYRGKNDGLVVFNTFQTGEFNMMQMHVLVSGEAKQFLLSYTDLQERFSAPETYAKAWSTMTSIEVTGVPPTRYKDLIIGTAACLAGFLCLMVFKIFRRRRERNMYMADADEIYSDDVSESTTIARAGYGAHKGSDLPATRSGVWNINDKASAISRQLDLPESNGEDFASVSYVSSFR